MVFLSLTVIQLAFSLTEGNQLQNLINFARGEGRPPGGGGGRSGSAAGRSGSGAGSAPPEGAAVRSGSVLSLAAPAVSSSFPQHQAFIPPPIPFAGTVTYVIPYQDVWTNTVRYTGYFIPASGLFPQPFLNIGIGHRVGKSSFLSFKNHVIFDHIFASKTY